MIQLLQDGMRMYPEAEHFQFVSESCLPVVIPGEYLQALRLNMSYIPSGLAGGKYIGSSQWLGLCRNHAQHVVRNKDAIMKIANSLPRGAVPDEIAIPYFLHRNAPPRTAIIVNRVTTWVNFPIADEETGKRSSRPTTYPHLTREIIANAKRNFCFFARKFAPGA
jgi:hypothetical protein